jgi:hypothetical protein
VIAASVDESDERHYPRSPMSLLTDLAQGRGGVRFAVPARLTVDKDDVDVANLHDAERGVGWHLGRYDQHLDLRPEHQELLVRDVERHTRALFETYSRGLASGPLEPRPLRTEDPTWSPVVSVERVRLGGADALTVIHRMSYQPGNEMLMGHLLVPIRRGLFELRVLAPARMTGMRESMLFAVARKGAEDEPPDATMKRLGQKHYDDPQHDALFPDHPLSRVRAELRALLEEGAVTVTEPDEPAPDGEALLPAMGCAVTPPPRYARKETAPDFVQWSRLSFAGTDGLQLLTLLRERDVSLPQRGAQQLTQLAEKSARASVPKGATNVHVDAHALPDRDGRAQVLAYLSYDPTDGDAPRHTAFHWLVDDRGRPVAIAIATGRCVPKDELLADTEAVAASWRPLDGEREAAPPPAKKPWWKVW